MAADPDFTEDLLWKNLSPEVKAQIMETGVQEITWGVSRYPISRSLIEDGRNNFVLRNPRCVRGGFRFRGSTVWCSFWPGSGLGGPFDTHVHTNNQGARGLPLSLPLYTCTHTPCPLSLPLSLSLCPPSHTPILPLPFP